MDNNITSRRDLLRAGLGLAAGAALSGFIIERRPATEACSPTPLQDLGPFPPMQRRNQPDHDIDLTTINGRSGVATGKIIMVKGQVLDDTCKPVQNAIVEIWQTNHFGKYHHEYQMEPKEDENFQGWGQMITDSDGRYSFKTIVPSPYANRTRHIHFKVSCRGYHEMVTQMYFDGEPLNEKDGILNSLTHQEQMQVICKLQEGTGIPTAEFNIVLAKVNEGSLPAKVLAEYKGRFLLSQNDNTILHRVLSRNVSQQFKDIIASFSLTDGRLYMDVPMNPRIELFWKSKDRFEARAFYNTDLVFARGSDGNVNSLQILTRRGSLFTDGIKVQEN